MEHEQKMRRDKTTFLLRVRYSLNGVVLPTFSLLSACDSVSPSYSNHTGTLYLPDNVVLRTLSFVTFQGNRVKSLFHDY